MPEKDDKTEKDTKTRVAVGGTEFARDTSSRSSEQQGTSSSGDASRDRDRDYDDDYDDYGYRARRNAREFGDSVRDAGRSVRREGTDFLTAYCDLIGGIFHGIGDAFSPRSRGGSGDESTCGSVNLCGSRGGGSSRPYDDRPRYRSTSYDRDRDRGSERVSSTRTEVRRTSGR